MDMKAKAMTKDTMTNFATKTIIRRWGNSQGIRLSKEVLSQMDLKEDDTVGINKPKYLNLQERLEAFYKRPLEEIYVENEQEVDVGNPVGDEMW